MEIRPAIPSDKQPILDFCKTTFSWGDYIADVWDSWFSEGNLLVLSENKNPIAVCHTSIIKGQQVWIEGIRVKQNFRRKGFAKRLVIESELIGKKNNCKVSKMLIEKNNIDSLGLADKLHYEREELWNFFTLIPKKTILNSNACLSKNIEKILDFLSSFKLFYVRSWRWLPLRSSDIQTLVKKKRILISNRNGIVIALAIFIPSDHFEKTLIVTLFAKNENEIKDILNYIQNFSYNEGYKRIQILSTINFIPKEKEIEKKFSFYLMKKDLQS